jgi:hypothetical protein
MRKVKCRYCIARSKGKAWMVLDHTREYQGHTRLHSSACPSDWAHYFFFSVMGGTLPGAFVSHNNSMFIFVCLLALMA